MIWSNIASLLGLQCVPLDASGNVAYLQTPFTFADGNPVPVFMEHRAGTICFFDDGGVFMHFSGRGLTLSNKRQARFITQAAARHGATYTDDWILEAMAPASRAPEAFRRYMNAMHDICAWELANEGMEADSDFIVEKAIMAYRALDRSSAIVRDPQFTGISGKTHTLALQVDNTAISTTSAHPNAARAAFYNMVDIQQRPANAERKFMFLIADDDPESARARGVVLQTVAPVQMLSNLERQAAARAIVH